MLYRPGYDIFNAIGKVDIILIPTNGVVKRDGTNVMGAGLAKQFADAYSDLPLILGNGLTRFGNIPLPLKLVDTTILFSFPVKPDIVYVNGDKSNIIKSKRNSVSSYTYAKGWMSIADMELIKQSAVSIRNVVCNKYGFNCKVALPPVGCGLGELRWVDVSKVLSDYFDDRYTVYYK